MDKNTHFMHIAIQLSIKTIEDGGGPFGAVIVLDDEIIGKGVNRVVLDNDPTAHAEVNAIRNACQYLQHFDLSGCVIYSSCEPCPMCLSAIYWARIKQIYYGNSKFDVARINFDDAFIYKELSLEPEKRQLAAHQMMAPEAKVAFQKWTLKTDKTKY